MPSERAGDCDICHLPTATPIAASIKASVRHAKCQKEWLRRAWIKATPEGRKVLQELAEGISDER